MGAKCYNKILKVFMVMFLFITFFGQTVKGETEGVESVNKDKIWSINFNQKINFTEDIKNKILVTDKDGNKAYVRLELSEDKKSILVKPPIKQYDEGEIYKLTIGDIGNNTFNGKREIKFKINSQDKKSQPIKSGDIIKSQDSSEYIYNNVRDLKGANGEDIYKNGWKAGLYLLNKTATNNVYIENDEHAQSLKIPAKLSGWFGIYVGYITGTEEFKIKGQNKEEDIKIFNEDKNKQYVKECFAFAENFHESGISIDAIKGKKAKISYIKIVSLTDADVKLYKSYNEYRTNKRVIYNNDGYTDFFEGKCATEDELKKVVVDSVKKADGGEVNYEIGTTGMLNYNSKYAGDAFVGSQKYDSYIREGDKLARKQILNILNYGKSPLEIATSRGKEQKIKVNASMRMDAFYVTNATKFLNGTIYDKYIKCKQNEGHALSYYYPEFREYIENVLKEISEVDGVYYINLDFCRYPVLMGSEATPKEKIDIMNDFMRKIRKDIPNKKISVRVPYLNTLSYGLDVKTWIKEGLIDRLIPSSIGFESFYNIDEFTEMVKGTNVELYVGISANLKGIDLTKETEKLINEGKYVPDNEYLSVEDYLFRAHESYEAGAEGIFLFNTFSGVDFTKDYSPKFNLLGDKIKVKKWYKFEYPSYVIHDPIKIAF